MRLKRRAPEDIMFEKTDLLIQASLEIHASSISHRDRILIMNLSSTTTAITFVVRRRLVFPSSPHLPFTLSFLPSCIAFLFFRLSFRLFLSLHLPLDFFFSFTYSPTLYLSSLLFSSQAGSKKG